MPTNVLELSALLGLGAFGAGIVGALTGLGGGVVLVPMLTLLFKVDMRYAIGTALVSVIAVEELLLVANQTASANFKYLEALTAAGVYYLAMTTIFMVLVALAERSLAARRRRPATRISFTQRLLGATSGSAAVR